MDRNKTIGIVVGFVCVVTIGWLAWDIQQIISESHAQYQYRVEGNSDAGKLVLGWLRQLESIDHWSWLWFLPVLPAALSTALLILGKATPRTHLLVTLTTLIGLVAAVGWALHKEAWIWLETFGRLG